MVTIPNQSSVPKPYEEFDEDGRMKPPSVYDRVVDVMEDLVKFTLMLRGSTDFLEGTEAQPVVRVSDTGPGIAPADRGAVFRKFFRTDASRTKPGSGLGLGLVAEILALHRFGVTIGDERPGCRIELLCWPGAAGPDSVDQRETRSEEAHGSPYRK